MEFRILGPLEAVDDAGKAVSVGSGKRSALLADLLLNVNRTLPVARLIDDLWGDSPPDTATKAVQIYVSQLRKALPERIVHTRSPGYILELSPERVDLYRFEQLVSEGREALAAGAPERASELLSEALALWRGAALAEFEEPFAQVEGARIEELRLAALEDRIEADLARGRHGELTAELDTLLHRYPLRERLYGQQMIALYRAGRQAEALACYQDFRRLLDEQLGIEPSQRLRELERRILQQDAGLEPTPASPAGASPPARTAQPSRPAPLVPDAEEPAMVGRDGELGALRRLLDEALAGHRQVAFVSGQAGIGKTTLAEALLGEAEAAGELLVARGRCFEQFGAGDAYMPLLEALEQLCRSPDGDAVTGILARHAPTWLAELPGQATQATPGATRERTLRELMAALDELAALRPTVLLLEDLHWSDPSTVDVLSALARREGPARLMVLGTYRPSDARAAEHPIWDVVQELRLRALASEIQLTALPARAMVDYLGLRFPDSSFPIELPQLLHERTDGNPLFVAKVVDSWLEAGAIAPEDGSWQLHASIAELAIEVPATVRQLIEHQLDRLEAPDQQLVESASAAGAEFATAAVAAASARDPEEVETRCAQLAAQGRFFRALGEQAWPDGTVSARYAFVHDLYQEIAYSRLPPARRARLHREIGDRLEAGYGPEAADIAGELATHFVRGRDPERAVFYLRSAAAQALQRAGHHEAIEHLNVALATLQSLPATRDRDELEITLRVALGESLMETRGYAAPEVREAFTQARDLCTRLGDTPQLLRVLNGLSTIAEVSGAYRAALDLAEESLRLAEGGPEDALADARSSLGWPLLCLGRLGAAMESLEPLMDDVEAARYGSVDLLFGGAVPGVEARAVYAWALWLAGYPDQAVTRSEGSIRLAEELGHHFSTVYAVICDAFVRQLRRDRDVAAERAANGRRLAAEHGLPLWEAWASIILGWAADGDPDAALAEIRAGLDASAATGAAWARTYLLALLAETYYASGQYESSLQTIQEALDLAGTNDERFYEPELQRLRGELELKLGRQPAAEASLTQSLEIAKSLGARMLELRASVSLGRLWRDQGRREEAGELVAAVYGWFTEGFGTADLTEARELLEELGVPIPEPGSAVALPGPVAPAADGRAREVPLIVGRGAELERLRDLLEEALRGERRVVLVTGDAGQGKTTLVDAFLAEASASGAIRVARGQCVEQHGAGEAYMPVLEALDRMCREPGGDELVALLSERAPTWILHMPWLVPPGGRESLAQRTVGTTTDRMLREIVEALGAIAVSRPLVLLLEDLHWSDASTLDLVSLLARRSDPTRLLLLGTFRPREDDGDQRAQALQELGLRGLATEIPLGTLSAAAVDEYIASRFPGSHLPREVAGLLHERTGGSPLFMEAVVDAWIDAGCLRRSRGGWVLASTLDELAVGVPPSLRRLIEHQLGRLEGDDQRLLEAASVAGRDFSAALVAAACERDEDEVESRCAALAGSSSPIEPRGTEEWPDGTVAGRYGFVHDLHQEVLYERIPPGRRTRLHSRVGNRLEGAYGERAAEMAPELAAHFLRGAEGERAVHHLRSAAEQALSRSAPREAVDHLQAAIAVLSGLPESVARDRAEAAVQGRLAPALIAIEGWGSAAAQQALDRAEALHVRNGDVGELARVLYKRATVLEVRGDYRKSEQVLEELLALPGSQADDRLLVDSHELLACSLFHQGAFEPALGHADEGLGFYDGVYANPVMATFGDHSAVSCHTWAALSLWFLGRPEQAFARAREAIVLAESPPRRAGKAVALIQAAIVAQCALDAAQTREWAEAALAEARSRGFTYRIAGSRILHGWALAALGNADDGVTELREGLELSQGIGAQMDDAYYGGLLADAYCRAGAHDEGLRALDEALATVRGSRTFFYEAELHRLRGELRLRQGLESDGEASLLEAIKIAQRQGARMLELRAAVSLLRLKAGRGETDGARELVRGAYAAFSEGFGTHDLVAARTLLEELGATIPQPAAEAATALPAGPGPGGVRPPVRYAKSGELSIAYEVTGSGPVDVVLVPGFVSHLEKDWEEPRHAHFLERLGSFSRLIRFDKRGTGLSDRPPDVPDLETRMDDVRAVMEAAGSERAVLFGYSEGGPLSILFAATYPDRVTALVLYGVFAKRMDPDDDYPWTPTREARSAYIDNVTAEWGFESDMKVMCPSADDAMARWWGERCRAAASPGAVRALMEMNSRIDVRDLLPTVHVPTLVVHRGTDVDVNVAEGRYIAERIPGARFVELPGADHFVAIDPDQILDVVEPFVRGSVDAVPVSDRVLATVLVTDIVGSTETAARLGDANWSRLLSRHHELVREELERFAGEEIDTAGDGFLALFDGPSRAIRCGLAVSSRLEELGLPVRVGVHTGEVERAGAEVRGIAVHLAARVAAAAAPGDVLVTATTRDIVAGSGLGFDDRGEQELKGFDEPRRLFAAKS